MPNSVSRGPPCPICGAPSARGQVLTRPFLVSALEAFLEAPVPPTVRFGDYAMCRCTACTLEFADPPTPADDAFYDWLDREGRYYEQDRWEWNRAEELIVRMPRPVHVLEFGAGDARFLRRLQNSAGAQTVAIERSAPMASKLRESGIDAWTDDEAPAALAGRRFDFVLAFHCIEHVADPVGLLRNMLQFAPAGRILFSVPYSPMYFESHWFDPLNHPPHHLSRWNRASLESLATTVGCAIRLSMPAAHSTLARARYALAIRCLGPHWHRHRRRWRVLPFLHPVKFAGEIAAQLRRDRVHGRPAADVVLAELRRESPSG